jgi:hypothetical protein
VGRGEQPALIAHLATAAVVGWARPRERAHGPDLDRGAELRPPPDQYRHYFEGIEILLVEEDAQGNALLGYDEPGDTTSIDCCVLGDAAVCGLQGPFEGRYGISVRDFGEVHDAWVFRTRVDWYMGFAVSPGAASAWACPPRSATLTPRLTLRPCPCGRREPLPS